MKISELKKEFNFLTKLGFKYNFKKSDFSSTLIYYNDTLIIYISSYFGIINPNDELFLFANNFKKVNVYIEYKNENYCLLKSPLFNCNVKNKLKTDLQGKKIEEKVFIYKDFLLNNLNFLDNLEKNNDEINYFKLKQKGIIEKINPFLFGLLLIFIGLDFLVFNKIYNKSYLILISLIIIYYCFYFSYIRNKNTKLNEYRQKIYGSEDNINLNYEIYYKIKAEYKDKFYNLLSLLDNYTILKFEDNLDLYYVSILINDFKVDLLFSKIKVTIYKDNEIINEIYYLYSEKLTNIYEIIIQTINEKTSNLD